MDRDKEFIKNFKLPKSCSEVDTYDNVSIDTKAENDFEHPIGKNTNFIIVHVDNLTKNLEIVDKGKFYVKRDEDYFEFGYKDILYYVNGKLQCLHISESGFLKPTLLHFGLAVSKYEYPWHPHLFSYNKCKCVMTDKEKINSNIEMEKTEKEKTKYYCDYVFYDCSNCQNVNMEYPHITHCTKCKMFFCSLCSPKRS